MALDPWLPQGYSPAEGVVVQRCVQDGDSWQVFQTRSSGRVLVATPVLAAKWVEAKVLVAEQLETFAFGDLKFVVLTGGRGYRLESVDCAEPPMDESECEAFVSAIRETRNTGCLTGLHGAIYVERLSRLLPCFSPAPTMDDATLAGAWISGGVPVSLASTRRMQALVPWLGKGVRQKLLAQLQTTATTEPAAADEECESPGAVHPAPVPSDSMFALPGRPLLEAFFNEHVVDLVRNEERYKALGIMFPGAVLLYGPPGCGKTFAVEKLVEFLDWPFFSVDSGSIGSPYIHETGKKIAEIFDKAADSAPSVIVIDEVDAFLAAREGSATGQYRVEEVAEFLRVIPNAAKRKVLVVGMTNRLDSLDPAIVRRGRFDHIIEVGMPTEIEVLALLTARMAEIPHGPDVDLSTWAARMAGRPLSDVGFVIREACRLAARSGKSQVEDSHVLDALASTPSRGEPEAKARKIGFV